MDLGLNGKRALVTGSTAGIGAATVKQLAAEGARVAVHGRNRERAEAIAGDIRAKGGEAIVVLGDLATREGCDAVIKGVTDGLGGLDILVNNAGGSENPSRTWADVEWKDFLENFEINTGSAFRLIKYFLPGMKAQKWGRIIQFSSTSATMPAAHTEPSYAAVKASLITMTTSLSKTFAKYGITVNCITPGAVDTPVYRKFVTNLPPFRDKPIEEINKTLAKRWAIPAGHLGEPDDLAPAVAFLCSRQADWITGVNLRIDGGMSFFINT
jgi:NAD(P)-dependent dehydrogenase (short-subunit alcohol dehydrogenase family)